MPGDRLDRPAGRFARRRQRQRGAASSGTAPVAEPAPVDPPPVETPPVETSADPVPPPIQTSTLPTTHQAILPTTQPRSRGRNAEQLDRVWRDLAGAGPSRVGVSGALRARDVDRPTAADLAEAEQALTVIRRNWSPPEPPKG